MKLGWKAKVGIFAANIASLFFMGLTFFTEIFGGRGKILYDGKWVNAMTFIEPNIAIAFSELVVILVAIVGTFVLFLESIRE